MVGVGEAVEAVQPVGSSGKPGKPTTGVVERPQDAPAGVKSAENWSLLQTISLQVLAHLTAEHRFDLAIMKISHLPDVEDSRA